MRQFSGHTDKTTINKRRPMSVEMWVVLASIRDGSRGYHGLSIRNADRATKNRVRALVDRGYASYGGDFAYITDAGREALK